MMGALPSNFEICRLGDRFLDAHFGTTERGERWVPMRPQRQTGFLLNSIDRQGRKIAPAILCVAQEIGPRAVLYAERQLGDPAVAATLFEEAAASVSEAVEQRKGAERPAVTNLSAYLFRTFIRIVAHAKRRETLLQESLRSRTARPDWVDESSATEAAIFLDEVMATCDRVSREVGFRRLEGFSWQEIGERYGMSAHAAEARFSKALDHARKMLNIRRREG